MDEGYFVEQRQKFNDALEARRRHGAEASLLASNMASVWCNKASAVVHEINPHLATLQFQYLAPQSNHLTDEVIGMFYIKADGGTHSGYEFETFSMVTDPDTLEVKVYSGDAVVKILRGVEVQVSMIERFLVNHAFYCLKRRYDLA